MQVIFSEEAKRDLDDLRRYLEPLNRKGLASVGAAIEARVRAIAANPGIGRPTPRDDVREAVEPKYGFLIPYHTRGERLFVLRIYRSARRPIDYETLDVPAEP